MENTLSATPDAIECLTLIKEAREQLKVWQNMEKIYKDEAVEKYFKQYSAIVRKDGYVVGRYYDVSQTRFDSKKFEEEHPELHKKYMVLSSYKKLDIKI